MNNEENKTETPNTNTAEAKKAEESKTGASNVTVNVHEGASWLKPTLLVAGGVVAGALGALGVLYFFRRSDDAATGDTTADA